MTDTTRQRGRISAALARRWAHATAQELAEWGHGHLAADAEGGVCIVGLANTRGCCWSPMPIEAASGTVVLQRTVHGDTDQTHCVNCGQALQLTRWAQWTGRAAATVAAEIAATRPQHLDPIRPWPAQGTPRRDRKHWLTATGPEVRGRRIPPMFGHQRAALRWAAARLPSPAAAVAAAEAGRGRCQSERLRTAEQRCANTLPALPRQQQSAAEQWLDAAAATLRICTPDTHGRTVWEPEIVLQDTPGCAAVAFLSPVRDGDPIAPAAHSSADLGTDQRGRRQWGDESRWAGEVCSFAVDWIDDLDPAALARIVVPPSTLDDVQRGTCSLRAMWQAVIGGHSQTPVPEWLTAPDVGRILASRCEQHTGHDLSWLDDDWPAAAENLCTAAAAPYGVEL